MSKRNWILSISTVILISAVVAAFVFINRDTSRGANSAEGTDINTLLTNILNSHANWTTAKGEAEIIWYGPQGDAQRNLVRFEISQPGSARFESIVAPMDNATGLWISDGENIFEVDLDAGTYTSNPLPKFALDLGMLPTSLAEVETDTLYSHPFSLLIPSPVSELIYPHWFPQGRPDAVYSISGQEQVIERNTWLVDYTDDLENHQLLWIDQQTGMILQLIRESNGQKTVEIIMRSLIVDTPLDPDRFTVPAEITN